MNFSLARSVHNWWSVFASILCDLAVNYNSQKTIFILTAVVMVTEPCAGCARLKYKCNSIDWSLCFLNICGPMWRWREFDHWVGVQLSKNVSPAAQKSSRSTLTLQMRVIAINGKYFSLVTAQFHATVRINWTIEAFSWKRLLTAVRGRGCCQLYY